VRASDNSAERLTSPVNGAGGITGCRDYAERPESFPAAEIFSYTVK
jgi:hypothetical protein